MPDYISREEAIKAIMSQPTEAHYPAWYAALLRTVPPVDIKVTGDMHGRWIEDDHEYNRCSECGYVYELWKKKTPFCPGCGANMEPNPELATKMRLLLGKQISKMLEKKGITQREYAEMIGVNEVAMSRYIKGERIPPAVLRKINRDFFDVALNRDCKLSHHKAICDGIHDLYEIKNHDYGDSFEQSFRDHGILAGVIRIEDKFNRLKTLAGGAEQKVQDESIRDTLRDMANYAIMTLLEMEVQNEENQSH